MVYTTDILSNFIREPKTLDSDDEDVKNDTSEDESISIEYARRDSQESNASSASNASNASNTSNSSTISNTSTAENEKTVDDLTLNLLTLKVEDVKPETDDSSVENLTDKVLTLKVEDATGDEDKSPLEALKNGLKDDDKNIVGRSPMRNDHNNGRQGPYQQPFRTSGGYIVPSNEGFNEINYLLPDALPDLGDLSDFLNNYLPAVEDPLPPPPSFTIRQPSPTPTTPNSSPSHSSVYSSDVLSPGSCTSQETDSSQPIGSPYSFCELPSTSGLSLSLSNSPARLEDLPKTLPNSSDEENRRNEAIEAMRRMIDSSLMDVKKYEWIKACQKDTEEELFNDLRKLLTESRLTNRRIVRIYATIAQILKRNGRLRQFFLEEPHILSNVALKNHPLLMRYIIETMLNLGLAPESMSESPTLVLRGIIDSNQNMSEMLTTLLSIRNFHNLPIFDVNQVDNEGFSIIHRILQKINQTDNIEERQLAINYLKIVMENQPDLNLRTAVDSRTYLHHAILWNCGPEVVQIILQAAQRGGQIFDFNLVNELDANGDSALKMAASLTEGRKEIENILLQFDAFNIYAPSVPFEPYTDFDPLSEF